MTWIALYFGICLAVAGNGGASAKAADAALGPSLSVQLILCRQRTTFCWAYARPRSSRIPWAGQLVHVRSANGWTEVARTDSLGLAEFASVLPGFVTVWCDSMECCARRPTGLLRWVVRSREVMVSRDSKTTDTLEVIQITDGISHYR